MTLDEIIASTGQWPVTIESLTKDLRQLGVEPGICLLAHTSLSTIGWVVGGAATVAMALCEAVGPTGTLVMPTHSTGLSDPANWSNPPVPAAWWPIIRSHTPPFDPGLTPSQSVGRVPEYFRGMPGVRRSSHPQTSFAARGPLATSLLEPHPLGSALGEYSPLAKLCAQQAMILLLGVGYEVCTSLHLAEHRASYPGKRRQLDGAPVLQDGHRAWVTFEDLKPEEGDFAALGAAYEAGGGEVRTGLVGRAKSRLLSQRTLIDFAIPWLEANRRAEHKI